MAVGASGSSMLIDVSSVPPARKRKHEDMFASSDPVRDNPAYISSNTTAPSCKANGLRGIYNAGATCYQNVVLQSFLHNPILRNFYLSDGHQSGSCNTSNCLSCAMDDMFQDFYALENTNGYTAANILSCFWHSERKAFENLVTTKEQDAHEFFQFLAEELHERNGDGKKPETGSEHSCNCIIHQTYYGKLQSTTTCQNCHGVTNQVQSFLDLSLPLENLSQRKGKKGTGSSSSSSGRPGVLTLQECLDEEYIKSDKCEYRCNKCNSMQQARRQTSIKRLPNVLSIQLKVRKTHACVPSPLSIFLCSALAGSKIKKRKIHFYLTDDAHPSRICRDSSTSKDATNAPQRSTRPCSSPSSSTCSPTRTGPGPRTSGKTTSWPAPAPTTCSASSCTSARSTRATTCRTVASATRWVYPPPLPSQTTPRQASRSWRGGWLLIHAIPVLTGRTPSGSLLTTTRWSWRKSRTCSTREHTFCFTLCGHCRRQEGCRGVAEGPFLLSYLYLFFFFFIDLQPGVGDTVRWCG